MDHLGWQKHTVRGFMAGAMKKAGYTPVGELDTPPGNLHADAMVGAIGNFRLRRVCQLIRHARVV